MRKIISRGLIFILVLSSFTGCGKSSDSSNTTKEVQYDLGDNQLNYAVPETGQEKLVADGTTEAPYAMQDEQALDGYNTEEYNDMKENGYQSVAMNPLSTFSIDVDTASYSNIRRMLTNGSSVDSGAVRLEEMINYFTYDYKVPQNGEPFSVTTEFSDCPWNEDSKLMLVGLQTEKVNFADTAASNLVFLIDVSGSMMDYDKLPLVQKAFGLLTENLTQKDRISIVTYASGDAVILEGANGTQTDKIMDAINQLEASGSTAGSAGIETAYEIAEKYFIPDGNNRVILATDGDLNVGISSESGLTDLITQKKESGVYLSVLGFGQGNIKDNKMEALADKGNGNYSYIDSLLEAKKVLVDEMGATLVTVAEDVKLQLEFNPNVVKGYRLVGYENRMLAAEDFEDDTKDAGEIGAGHSVTALYEVVLNDSKIEIPTSDLKYQDKSEFTMNEDELLTISIRYKKPGEDNSNLMTQVVLADSWTSKMPQNLNFASAVAEFGMLLRDSEYKGTSSYDGILEQLNNYSFEGDVYREEFVELVKTAQNMQ